MVMYDHLFATFGQNLTGQAFAPVPWIRHWISGPLGIIQDFGWLGVCIFFLISGFVIVHAAMRETTHVFALRRILRIYPPLALAIAVIAAFDYGHGQLRPASDYLLGISLLGYVKVPQVIVLGVAWTLLIELCFYALIGIVASPLKRYPSRTLALVTLIPLVCTIVCRKFGANFFLLSVSVSYVPILLIGSAIYLYKVRLTSARSAFLLAFSNFCIFMYAVDGIHTRFLLASESYPISVVYAIGIFLAAFSLPEWRPMKFLGNISYSLYLLHGSIGLNILILAYQAGFGNASPWLACAGVVIAAWGNYRWVELPSMALAKHWSKALQSTAGRAPLPKQQGNAAA